MNQNEAVSENYLEHISDAIDRNLCALFIGPESSVAERGYAGPPGPAMLMAELAERLAGVPVAPGDMSLSRIAQLYQNEDRMHDLRDYVIERLDQPDYQPTPIHYWASQIHFPFIVSTGYDYLLDRLIEGQRPKQWQTVIGDDLRPIVEAQYWKLFGSVKVIDSMRLTETQIEELFAVKIENRVLARLNEIAEMTLLFVGFYYDDELFRTIYRRIRGGRNGGARTAFFLPSPHEPAVSWGEKVGLRSISAKPEHFLSRLARMLSSEELPEMAPVLQPRPLSKEETKLRTQAIEGLNQRLMVSATGDGQIQPFAFRIAPGIARLFHHLQVEHPEPAYDEADRKSRARVSFGFGSAAWAEDNLEQAKEKMEEAIELDPDLIEARMALHRLLAEMGDRTGSMEQYNRAKGKSSRAAVLPPTYTIDAVVGVSNIGLVYKAYEGEGPDLPLSVTVLRRVLLESDELDSFTSNRERLKHPRIARFIRVDQHHGRPFVVHDYVEGSTLSQMVEQKEVDLAGLVQILDQVTEALEYAHKAKIAHLNLSTNNIIVSPTEGAMLVEFREFELIYGRSNTLTVPINRRDYLAPEQQAGDLGNELSDIYALGQVCQHLSELAPDDEAIEVFRAKAATYDPQRRFENIARFRQELHRISGLGPPEGETWIFEPLYRALSWMTRQVERLSPRWWLIIIALLLATTVVVEIAGLPVQITGPTRFVALLFINIVPSIAYASSRIRIIAQGTGYGSLIRSRHGLVIIYGFSMTLWYARTLTLGSELVDFWDVSGGDFLAFALVALILTFFVTFLMLIFLHVFGRESQRRWNRYLDGFYAFFLIWCGLILLMALFRQGQGLVSLPEL